MFTLGDIARKGARIYAAREAAVFEGTRISFGELDRRVNSVANALLGLGCQPGERVAILSENTHKYIEVYLAVAKAGLVTTPLNFRLSDRELAHILNDSEATTVLVGDRYEEVSSRLRREVPKVRMWIALDNPSVTLEDYEGLIRRYPAADPSVPVDENAMAVLMYTGGTTGAPKGVMLSHRNLLTAMLCLVQQYQFTERDRTCMLLPLFHASFWPAFCCLIAGGTTVVVRRPELPAILTAVQDERCTHINAVPTLYNWILELPELDRFDLGSLRLMTYAGSPIPEEVLRKLIARFGSILAQGYGLTEAAPVVSALMPEDHVVAGPKARLLKSVGKEMTVVEVRVVDEDGRSVATGEPGEVAVRGPNIMLGYWKNPEMTAAKLRGGWLHTGDVGVLDDEGYLYLVDRKADMIVTGGENVYPTETENVLYQHPAVQECAVSSAPDSKWGERVQAVVVLGAGAEATEEEMIEFCKERLAGYKCPKRVEFWESLPKSAVGKILRKDVKKTFWEGKDRQIG